MQIPMDEVLIFDEYSEDPDTENSFLYAAEATPVYVRHLDSGEAVLATAPGDGHNVYGYLHVFRERDFEEDDRLIVVRR